ncbi:MULTISPECIES: ThiF family adenylyltransferase [Brevundimonas]|uniref:ThiF family adenylyltransferase n=1 Tax=Brevundimonas TaxID=41275 RepID=UPI00106D181C|nr:ThiF family adenylyltransferase [Brevundimonas naejangsanensis]QBQ47324.1 hypothetical protein E3U41_00685 [Brevundimonas naejangsanensis]
MSEAARRVAEALALDGFKPKVESAGISFNGTLTVRGRTVDIRLDYDGLEFCTPPTVTITTPQVLGEKVIPHLDENNVLCAVDARQYVADRYSAAGQARGILIRVAEVLEEGLQVSSVREIEAEFPSHWGGAAVGVDFAPFDGIAEPSSDTRGKMRFRRLKAGKPPIGSAVVVTTPIPLSFRPDEMRPATLGEAVEWANSWVPGIGQRIFDRLVTLPPRNPYVMICAPNGIVGFEIDLLKRGQAVVSAMRTPAGWARLLRGSFGRHLPINRIHGRRVDMDYILGTNSLTGAAPLASKSIVLVGCGTIGGHLSVALAQSGAGLGGGSLTVIDHETLSDRNIGRHRLGREYVGLPKADGCKAEIDKMFTDLNVSAVARRVQDCRVRLEAADLVVDATGEQAVGDMLNAWRLEGTTFHLLHVWIEGNGAAVQSYFSSDPEFGCYRCLQPDLSKEPRYPVLRPEADRTMSTGCGEASFNPYGPAAPMSAAALGIQHALGWAGGRPRPLLRTIRLDYDQTQERKPTNPTRSDACPACTPPL